MPINLLENLEFFDEAVCAHSNYSFSENGGIEKAGFRDVAGLTSEITTLANYGHFMEDLSTRWQQEGHPGEMLNQINEFMKSNQQELSLHEGKERAKIDYVYPVV